MNINIKLINTVVKDRLNEIAEQENLLPKLSFGFRKNCSASTCVNYVVNRVHETKLERKQAIAVFLDLSGAFDSVDLSTLMDVLACNGIPNKLLSWLRIYLSRRKMVLRTEQGETTVLTSEGLPQGCPISPTMFNLYTAPLHKVTVEDCELVQFADDFTVLAKGANLDETAIKINIFLGKLSTVLSAMNFKLNVQKSAAIVFSNKNHEKLEIKIGQETVTINNTHKLLGFTLDRTLTFRRHIEEVTNQGTAKLNIIKLLGRRNSNASPDTLVKIGNAIIRSKTEYGAQIYGAAATTNLKKIQTLHNTYLRYAMRFLRTTPIHVILAEAGQMPVKDRIEMLTLKGILKSTFHENQLQPFVEKAIKTEEGNGSFLTTVAVKHNDVISQLHPKNQSATGRHNKVDASERAKIAIKLFREQKCKTEYNNHFWKQKFLQTLAEEYTGFHILYTDGSKSPLGTATATYDSTDQPVESFKINHNFSITNAELLGILHAVKMINRKEYAKAVIMTDSSGACQTLLNDSLVNENYLAAMTWEKIRASEYKDIRIQWIPSHQGIAGNERADTEAAAAGMGAQNLFNALTLGDTLKLAEKEIWDGWTREYQETSKQKGAAHFQLMKAPGKRIWCHGLTLTTEQKRIISRIRSGHTLTKDRLKRWGWETDDLCEICEEQENLHHLLYECPKFNKEWSSTYWNTTSHWAKFCSKT
ncbi:uncharacterized protein LOC131680379 [Topomyia yanbarensis]|uniref:uncharacterized protein LOC131680379 n=1 Tax=Topomyia yanbarensis TaxID=2498891 RepID=UPI00273B9337|nr:uncharacterized protein LOC131680379 [Topomyia yanbarensis]